MSRDKGTTGQPQNLTTGRDGPGQPKFGTGQAGTTKIRDGTRDKMGQSRKGHSKTGKRCSKTENDVQKQEKDVLKQKMWSFYLKIFNSFCPGTSRDRGFCPGTFAPALVPGQRDTGTRKFFCPGTKGQRDVPSRGNPNVNKLFSFKTLLTMPSNVMPLHHKHLKVRVVRLNPSYLLKSFLLYPSFSKFWDFKTVSSFPDSFGKW